MDAEGGEKIETICRLYGVLERHASSRGLLSDEFYFLGDSTLCKFKMFQGFDPFAEFPGCRLQQAHLIWLQTPKNVRNAVLAANGLGDTTGPWFPGIHVFHD